MTKAIINFNKGFASLILAFILVFSLLLSGCSTNSEPPKSKDPQVNTPVIKNEGVLKVGVNTSLSPLAGTGNSKIIGIDVDIASALADELGLKVEFVDVGTTPSKALQNGEVDICFGIDSSDTPRGARLTDSYLSTGVCLFALNNSSAKAPALDSTPKIGAQSSSKSAWAVTNMYGKESLVSSSDLSTCLTSLSSNTINYFASDAVIGMYAANKNDISVKVVAVLGNVSGYCAAISDTNADLYSIISTKLKELVNNKTIETIQKKWLGSTVDLNGVEKISKSGTSDSSQENTGESEESPKKAESTNTENSSSESVGSGTGSTARATDANDV